MPAKEKFLWTVGYDNLAGFVKKAVAVGATAVAIRTDNDLPAAITAFKSKNIKVFGWRWPSTLRASAMHEAKTAAGLLQNGMDGYFVDPEGHKKKSLNWDQDGLDQLADDFCKTVTSAAPNKPFGTTSHYRGKMTFPRLPWTTFFKYSSVLLPQAYWRSDEGKIGDGIPGDNYATALAMWKKSGGAPGKIVPMAGELMHSTGAEIDEYASAASASKIATLHFYTYEADVSTSVWASITRS